MGLSIPTLSTGIMTSLPPARAGMGSGLNSAAREIGSALGVAVDFPGGEPPAELQVTDIWEGDGGTAKAGDTVQVHYVGAAYSTGEEFDASWDRGDPLEVQLGAGRVIAGGDQGVQGMKVGGRRQLIIPPIWPTGTGAPATSLRRARPLSSCATWSPPDGVSI